MMKIAMQTLMMMMVLAVTVMDKLTGIKNSCLAAREEEMKVVGTVALSGQEEEGPLERSYSRVSPSMVRCPYDTWCD